ncbi:IS701 family transposase [Aporhodopirellula aestuarii]|uniref:Transposase n=1 Tax=Aporhodopirellula aestuarii TaxID=2950107 RepID=A0ABT0UDF1_9BACT|nr:transposase [Aporhodopirellula aestuarii]MCM2375073.1 transposase [Aporhodopirellula aestuarii]
MIRVPREFKPLMDQLSSATRHRETANRLILFFAAATLVIGDRTVSAVLRLLSLIEPLNASTYHRLFSHRRWCSRRFARIIAHFVVDRFCPEGVIRLVGDETVDGHRGKKVYGKARHRDAVRSSHSHTVYRYGHKWVVLAVLVDLPYTSRPMALPLAVTLYRDRKTNQSESREHRTPAELMVSLLALLMHWFPDRKFVFAGDNAYGSHAMARFAYRHRRRITLVSKIVPDANLFRPPPRRRGKKIGRPAVKGDSLPAPCDVVASKKCGKKITVGWYGGGVRNVEVISGTGGWYKSGKGLVMIRWVYVHDLDATHRDEYFFSTDTSMSAKAIIEMYCGRWNIETTFQELRSHLGLETTRGWSRRTVLRMAPALFVMYTVVVTFYDTMPESSSHFRCRTWLGKEIITFSDMIISVRHHLWCQWVFEQTPGGEGVRKLSAPIRKLLDFGLTQAA